MAGTGWETTNLYERVALDVEHLIAEGSLRPGDKLPSLRTLSRQQQLSVSTVLQAYVLLESRGLVEARDRSGFYVRSTCSLAPSPEATLSETLAGPVTVGDLIAQVFRAAKDPALVPFGAACPAPALLPHAKIARLIAQIVREEPGATAAYDFAPGLPALRRQIARHALEYGCQLAPDDILTTCGGTEALLLCLRAVAKAGDAIAIESPTFFGILQMIESLGMQAVEIPTHPQTGLSLPDLEEAIGRHGVKAVIAIPNFLNPLGALMEESRKAELVELLARYEVPLIEDDLYGDLAFGPERPKPCKAFDTQGLVMLCSSFSKTLGPGLRVGWCAPGRFRRQVEALKVGTTLATPTLPQMAIARFMEQSGYQRHLKAIRVACREQIAAVSQAVAAAFPAGTRISRPQGGFMLWVELPEGSDALLLYRRALEAGICLMPGPMFSASGKFGNCLRLSCTSPWNDALADGIERLGRLAAESR